MSFDEVYQLRLALKEKDKTINELRTQNAKFRDAIRAHQEVKHNTLPVGGFQRCDKSLWEMLEDEPNA